MAYGAMMKGVAARMKGGGLASKKPFMNDTSRESGGDTGDDSVDATAGDEENELGSGPIDIGSDDGKDLKGSDPVNAKPDTDVHSGGSADEGEGPELGSYDAVEDDAASELASLAGIPADKSEAFKSALSDYVAACVRKAKA